MDRFLMQRTRACQHVAFISWGWCAGSDGVICHPCKGVIACVHDGAPSPRACAVTGPAQNKRKLKTSELFTFWKS